MPASANFIYAGIGSRSAPPRITDLCKRIARVLEMEGGLLRSGGAKGCDSAFESGVLNPARKSIYMPSDGFHGRRHGKNGCYDAAKMPGWIEALGTVDKYHPNPHALSSYARRLMARNAMQVLGPDLRSPADFVVCWTPLNSLGGTGQAIRIAEEHDVPVCNLNGIPGAEKFLDVLVGLLRDRSPLSPLSHTLSPL